MTKRIVVTDHDFPSLEIERELAASQNVEIKSIQASTERDVIEGIESADAILNSHAPITRTVLEADSSLQVIGRYGIGVDTVDIEAATKNGIQVVNVPSYCIEEVSTHALALLLSVVRRTPKYDQEVKNGTWDWMTGRPLQRLNGRTIGFVGFGKIAHSLCEKLRGFNPDFIAYDPYISADEMAQQGIEKVSFDEFVRSVDIASVHAPLTNETQELFDGPIFRKMKKSAIIINTSRGSIINVKDLYNAIDNDEIYGAGLDVVPTEPPEPESVSDHHRIVHTPHVGWYSESSIIELRKTVMQDVLRILKGNRPTNPVNNINGEERS